MRNDLIRSWKEEARDRKIQDLCVLMTMLVELVYFSPLAHESGAAWMLTDYFLVIPSVIFLVLGLRRGIRGKGSAAMVLGLVMLAWFVLVEVFRLTFGMQLVPLGTMACFYAMALPMAFALDDGRRQWGITALAILFVAEGVRICVLAAGLILDILPWPYSVYVNWDGARLRQMFHPTTCAILLMLGMGCCIALCIRTKKQWLRLVLLLLTVVQFCVQTMTNGRNAAGFTCLMLGGILFCAIRGTGWKRAPIALAAGVAAMALLFLGSQKMYALHEQYMNRAAIQAAQAAQAEETAQSVSSEPDTQGQQESTQPPQTVETIQLAPENHQSSLLSDLSSFNGRTLIWVEAVNGALRHPTILLCGTDSMKEILDEGGRTAADHTHNSFLETLYTLGIPGVLLALAITVLALRAAAILLWKNTDLWKSTFALLTLCLLGSGLLEPYLYAAKNYHHYLSVFFLTAVGYLHQWCQEAKQSK